ncbi:MAG: 5-histidylcysteine sulfoxide synthase [Acidobacteriota bacterium]
MSSPSSSRNPNLDLESLHALPAGLELSDDDPLVGERPGWWWTGRQPVAGECPGLGADGVLRSLPLPDLSTCTRTSVQDYFDNGWALTEVLLSSLQGEQALLTPAYHHLRHPILFYLGHPATLYVNKLRLAGLISEPINPYFERVFETGVDEMSWDDMSKNEMEWPSVQEVCAYRATVHERVSEIIATHEGLADGHDRIGQDHPLWALFLGFEHERIHLETSSVLLRELPLSLLSRPAAWPALHESATVVDANAGPSDAATDKPELDAARRLRTLSASRVELGKPRDWPSFGWDNEYGHRSVDVRDFEVSETLVSNAEFHDFVADGGYNQEELWTEDGWRWRRSRNAKWPSYWVSSGPAGLHQYRLRTVFDLVEMPWSWPAEVNWYEAQAYCTWKSEKDGRDRPYRLPTEAEHARFRGERPTSPAGDPVMARPAEALLDLGRNLNLALGSPTPVDALQPNSHGLHDVAGNVWQWLADDFNPLDGFDVHPVYDDFSAPCFDGEHAMMVGGSFVSTGDEASVFARFHFRPHFFQHVGFRLASDLDPESGNEPVLLGGSAKATAYEVEAVVGMYLLSHYGSPEESFTHELPRPAGLHFARDIAEWAIETAGPKGLGTDRAIELGCAVGGSSFALARRFGEVLGIDLSERFIEVAEQVRNEGRLGYSLVEEGEIESSHVAAVDEAIDRERVSFRRADACALPPELEGYDLVLAANLLCRVPSPRAVLSRFGGPRGLVKEGGFLALATPWTWMADFSPRGAWLGGRIECSARMRTPMMSRFTKHVWWTKIWNQRK